ARTWLQDFLGRGDPAELEEELARFQKQQSETMAKLAAAKAWGHCFTRMTEQHRQDLRGWANAIKQIRGKSAEKFRRDAQNYLDSCRTAVPAWVMPFHRVAETVSASGEPFDVAIIDEASQSGPEALALLYLAKKIIIVGDPEQISPQGEFISIADVDSYAEQYLEGFPHRASLGVSSSLFHQADIRFGNRIVLREHFRCMPEIIRFSSDLCYRGQLEPLRQYPPQRLEPIVVRHVADGYREGASQSARNPVEADALVEAICECCRKTAYAGKTIGVISLQGEAQANLINSLLVKRLTPEEIEGRGIMCGDAYAFQGDERDIMFLSMVAAPNARFQALTTDAARQRFNVAASRARDQVWLFHSVTLNDMNPSDMRYKLLAYYSDPRQQPTGGPDWEKCESKFERAVGEIIHRRHYRIVPQFEPFGPNGKRIDFVIDGDRTRLAVECDGPHHDEPEQIVQDLVRQRQLERCGWTFWRVSAAAFYANPEAALSSLWRKLTNMGIHPIGAAPASPQTTLGTHPSALQAAQVFPQQRRPPSVVVQTDFLPDRKTELFVPSQPNIALETSPEIASTETDEESLDGIIAALRARNSNFLGEDMRRVILAAIPRREKIAARDVIRQVLGGLKQEGAAYANRVNELLEKMMEERILIGNLTQVWRNPKD
ncbi:MAG: AAA domain-containing protein, partial [Terrimicrobiaceae bacterium]